MFSKRTKTMDTSSDPKTLLSLFLTTSADDHIPRGTTDEVYARKIGPVMVVSRDDTLPRVLRRLTTEGFLSAPVVDGNRFVGFIDMMDLVMKTRELFWGETVEAWVDFWEKEENFLSTTVEDVMMTPSIFDRDPSPPLESNYTTFAALETMVRGDLHRLALVRPGTKKLNGILTQSMLISWLRQNKSLLGTLRTLRVRDMVDLSTVECRTINENQIAINAFTEMANLDISGLAVVDDAGTLDGSISIRDLRAVGDSGEYFYRLFRPIKEFKRLAREDHPRLAPPTHYSRRMVPKKGRYVTMDQTFVDVLDKMVDGNIHRIYVCDSHDRPKPIHVISQVDLLKAVLDYIIKESDQVATGR